MIRTVKNIGHFILACIAVVWYRFPARTMKVIGVTGTDGKTTTTHLIYEILKTAGKKVSLVSSIHAAIDGTSYDTGFHVTTPSPFSLQKFLRLAANQKSEYFVLEVTSHALDQYRCFGASIDVGLITNISHEHLDYHGSLAEYRAAKAKILSHVSYSILNIDDSNFDVLKKHADGEIITFGVEKKAQYMPPDFSLKSQLPGAFNLYNCLAAATACDVLGIEKTAIARAISSFRGIPGRMEEIKTKKSFRIFIDFAHKPNALEQALRTARDMAKNKVIVVFGCAGLRDRLKRPMMGEIAGRLAHYTILTAEDPRTEDVRDINEQIARGCKKAGAIEKSKQEKDPKMFSEKHRYFWRIPDRQEAINFAIRHLAHRGDIVLTLGKGHEQSMCYGRIEYPWNEHKAIEKALYGTI